MATAAFDVKVVNELVQRESAFVDRLLSEVSRVIVGSASGVMRLAIARENFSAPE